MSFLTKLDKQKDELLKTFHTSPDLMSKKQELEKLVRSLSPCELKRIFKTTPYPKRKIPFYENIRKELCPTSDESVIENILQIRQEILDIYKVKHAELKNIEEQLNSYYAEVDHAEEMRESLMEMHRYD